MLCIVYNRKLLSKKPKNKCLVRKKICLYSQHWDNTAPIFKINAIYIGMLFADLLLVQPQKFLQCKNFMLDHENYLMNRFFFSDQTSLHILIYWIEKLMWCQFASNCQIDMRMAIGHTPPPLIERSSVGKENHLLP